MNPEPLDQLFRSLPREKASELFTQRVMARLPERAAHVPAPRRGLAFALAALFVVTAGLVGAAGWRRAETAEQTRLAARAEQQRLQSELQQIKEMTAGLQPVFYVGSTPQYDYFIDLRTLEQDSAVAQPASYQPDSRPGL